MRQLKVKQMKRAKEEVLALMDNCIALETRLACLEEQQQKSLAPPVQQVDKRVQMSGPRQLQEMLGLDGRLDAAGACKVSASCAR